MSGFTEDKTMQGFNVHLKACSLIEYRPKTGS